MKINLVSNNKYGIKNKSSYTYIGASSTGSQREKEGFTNEDYYLIDQKRKVLLMADGAGGQNQASLASYLAVHCAYTHLKTLYKKLQTQQMDNIAIKKEMENSIQLANFVISQTGLNYKKVKRAINNINRFTNELPATPTGIEYLQNATHSLKTLEFDRAIAEQSEDLATTLDIMLIHNNTLYSSHVGNGRIILINNNTVTKITKEQVDTRNQPEESNPKYWDLVEGSLVARNTIGKGSKLTIDSKDYLLEKGDIILGYTDGVAKTVSLTEIVRATKRFSQTAKKILHHHENPKEQAELYADMTGMTLQEAKDALAGEDNATIVGVQKVR